MTASEIYDKYASLADPADLIFLGRETLIGTISEMDPTENAELVADAILEVAEDLVRLNRLMDI